VLGFGCLIDHVGKASSLAPQRSGEASDCYAVRYFV
jgi:hypothetical protein